MMHFQFNYDVYIDLLFADHVCGEAAVEHVRVSGAHTLQALSHVPVRGEQGARLSDAHAHAHAVLEAEPLRSALVLQGDQAVGRRDVRLPDRDRQEEDVRARVRVHAHGRAQQRVVPRRHQRQLQDLRHLCESLECYSSSSINNIYLNESKCY